MSASDSILAKARQFGQLDRKCIELSYERAKPTPEDFNEYFSELLKLCCTAYSLWNEIKLDLGQVGTLNIVDRDVRAIVRQIREGRDFLVVRQYLTIAQLLNTNLDDLTERLPTDFADFVQERFHDLFDEFHSWFDIGTYYHRKALVGCIVVARPHDPAINQYYSEIREAYAFDCHRACVALCRSLVELVLNDALEKRGLLQRTGIPNIEDGREQEVTLDRLITRATKNPRGNPLLADEDRRRALRIKGEANKILHLRDRNDHGDLSVTEDATFELIRDTIRVVEAVISR